MGYKDDHFRFEEEFHDKERKLFKKQRKELSRKDRSKYKKTDQDKKKLPVVSTEGLLRGRVLALTADGILVDSDHKLFTCSLKGSLRKEFTRLKNLIAVGDFVQFEATSDQTGTIISIEERYSILSRAEHLHQKKQQLIAVNIDQVLITTSVLLPPLKTHLIDRYIIAARKGNMQPVIVVNKIDLLTHPPENIGSKSVSEEKMLFEEALRVYKDLQIPIVAVSVETKEGLDQLKALMHGKSSVFSGQSGVGKSSLINAITGSSLKIGGMTLKTKKGSHTTSATHLLPLEEGGFCIDTPGIRSFGVWDLKKEEVSSYFSDIAAFADRCKYLDCSHLNEPGCAVQKAVEKNMISHLRFDSYCALMTDFTDK
jgi:ribosome biogenesis GTPase